jgi:amino acid adenylation domain-containing protein
MDMHNPRPGKDRTRQVANVQECRGAGTVITEAERQQLAAWNATPHAYPLDMCVPQLVANQAYASPDAVALVANGCAITYRDLNCRANQLAHHLQSLGVGANVLVGACFDRSVDMVVGLLGILKAGGAYVPLDPAYPPTRLTFMLEDTRAFVLVTQHHLAAHFPHHRAQIVSLDANTPMLARQNTTNPAPSATATDLAYVIFTSGSTGQPKGVQITHGSLRNLIAWHQHAFSVSCADRATQLAGPGFDATGWELWPYLTAGASVYLADEEIRIDPLLLRDWLVAHQITISFVPTPVAEGLLALEWPPSVDLRLLLTGGDVLHVYPQPSLPFALVNNYGPTECTVVATLGRVLAREHADLPPPIGWPVAGAQVYILDEQRRQVPAGMPGEIYIGGAGLARGYLHRPELTAEKFVPHTLSAEPGVRLYRTGDLGRYLPDGQIAFLGRLDNQVKIRGYRIETDEVAFVLNAHPAIQASAVVAQEDTPGGKQLVAYVVLTPGAEVTVRDLQSTLAAHLPDYMIPATFVRLGALPLTPNGKVDRAALPPADAANTLRDCVGVDAEPDTTLAARVAGIVASLLSVERVGLDDNFFMLGGHSLLGTQVIARLSDEFGVDVSLRTLFGKPTVRELAAEIERLIVAYLEALGDEDAERLLAADSAAAADWSAAP